MNPISIISPPAALHFNTATGMFNIVHRQPLRFYVDEVHDAGPHYHVWFCDEFLLKSGRSRDDDWQNRSIGKADLAAFVCARGLNTECFDDVHSPARGTIYREVAVPEYLASPANLRHALAAYLNHLAA